MKSFVFIELVLQERKLFLEICILNVCVLMLFEYFLRAVLLELCQFDFECIFVLHIFKICSFGNLKLIQLLFKCIYHLIRRCMLSLSLRELHKSLLKLRRHPICFFVFKMTFLFQQSIFFFERINCINTHSPSSF